MSVLVNAIMQHSLTPKEIIGLPNIIGEKWTWTGDNIDECFLKSYWDREVGWYLKNEWSQADLAIIDGPEDISIHFREPKLLDFNNLTHWDIFKDNKVINNQFKEQAKNIARIVKSDRILFIPDLGTGMLPDEIDQLDKIESLDNLIQRLVKNNETKYELEFN